MLRIRELTAEEHTTINRLAHSRTAPARTVERTRILWQGLCQLSAHGLATTAKLSYPGDYRAILTMPPEEHPMTCPTCGSSQTNESTHRTALGYRTFRCSACKSRFNERSGTSFNNLQFPTDIALLVVRWRLRYKLSLRDLAEMFLERGFEFTHETVRAWETRFAPLITEQLRAKRKGTVGKSWRCDETYIKIGGKWHYLYRAIDSRGNLVDTMLSKNRDMDPAKRFFQSAKEVAGGKPERVTTDGHPSYPRASHKVLGRKVQHRTNKYLNNYIEQDHRGVKQRYYSLRGFGNFEAAARFCRAYDEQRNYFRTRTKPKEPVSLAAQRRLFWQRFAALQEALSAA